MNSLLLLSPVDNVLIIIQIVRLLCKIQVLNLSLDLLAHRIDECRMFCLTRLGIFVL